MRKGQMLFTYLHLAAVARVHRRAARARASPRSRTRPCELARPLAPAARADVRGGRPARTAGRRVPPDARQTAAAASSWAACPAIYAAKVVVLGAGVSGQNAAAIALGMQAEVLLLDLNIARLRQMDAIYQGHVPDRRVQRLRGGARRARRRHGHRCGPRARRQGAEAHQQRARLADEAGLACSSTSRSTRAAASRTRGPPRTPTRPTRCTTRCSTASPTCRARCRNTSTYALTNVTLPYAVALANKGWQQACRDDRSLALGLNTHEGRITYPAVAEAFEDIESVSLESVLA